MLLTAVFPLCDTRPFLVEDAGMLPSGAFLPGFGDRRRRRPRRGAEPGDVCRARRAVRAEPAEIGHGRLRWVLRELSADGGPAVRVDLAVGSPLGKPGSGPPLASLARDWTTLLVSVPRFTSDPAPVVERQTVELRHAGLLLGPAYARATTAHARWADLRASWVTAGDPCFFVEWCEAESASGVAQPPLETVAEGVSAGFAELPAAGPRAGIWYVVYEPTPAAYLAAGDIRGRLGALHVERECLWAVIGQIADERLSPPGRPPGAPPGVTASPSSDALQRYLNDATSYVTRLQRAAPLPAVRDARAPAAALEGSRWHGRSFADALDRALSALDVRGNVRRKVVGWTRGETGEAVAPPVPIAPAPDAVTVEPPALPPAEPALEAAELRVQAALAALGRESAAPGEVVSFVLELRADGVVVDVGPAGASGGLPIPLGPGVRERKLTAAISTAHWKAPAGERWMQVFTVRRDGITPATSWSFRAKADGDRPAYELSVCFYVDDGFPLPALRLALPRRASRPLAPVTSTLGLPAFVEPRFTVAMTNEAGTTRVSWRWPGEDAWHGPFDLGYDVEARIGLLADPRYAEFQTLLDLGKQFRLGLPRALAVALEHDEAARRGLVVLSPATLVPFELLSLETRADFLGMEMPVMRWTIDGSPPAGDLDVRAVGCIQPNYVDERLARPAKAMAAEVRDLESRFGGAAPHAVDRAGLDALLARTDLDLLHFAGHADNDPAQLLLGDTDAVPPTYFSGQPLLLAKAPFFFINGCNAGRGTPGIAPTLANMVVALLRCNFAGVVAPLVRIDSEAACIAADAFYDAASQGLTVGEAVRAVHALAAKQPEKAVTFLSYVGYGRADLRLRVPPKPARG